MFGKPKIKVRCPECRHEFKVKVGQAEGEEEAKCPNCGKTFRLKKPDTDPAASS